MISRARARRCLPAVRRFFRALSLSLLSLSLEYQTSFQSAAHLTRLRPGMFGGRTVLGALRMQQKPPEAIKDLRVVVVGAGSAGMGVAQALQGAMVEAEASHKQSLSNFHIFDHGGLLGKSRFATLTEEQMEFARADIADVRRRDGSDPRRADQSVALLYSALPLP